MIIKKFEAFNPRIKRREESPYQLHVKYEHGDADFDTFETFSFTEQDKFDRVVHFFYDIMNFKPKSGYGNIGYFDPLPDMINAGANEKEINDRIEKIAKIWNVDWDTYIIGDNHYDQGYAGIEGVKATINGGPKVFVFKKALETNKISLPKIGDSINVSADNIPGYGSMMFGGNWSDYLPNSGKKDYQIFDFKARVLDCGIHFHHDEDNKYYTEYTSFQYILLLETEEDVLKPEHKLSGTKKMVYQIHGWDPDFETKFNKEKYDGLNYYEVD